MKKWFVADGSLHAVTDGFELDLRLPWYRSLPLSCIDFGDVRVNGEKVDHEAITVKLNGKERKLSELVGQWQEYWFVLDSAFVHIPYKNAKRGEQYQFEITVVLHPPYVPKVFFPNTYNQPTLAN